MKYLAWKTTWIFIDPFEEQAGVGWDVLSFVRILDIPCYVFVIAYPILKILIQLLYEPWVVCLVY